MLSFGDLISSISGIVAFIDSILSTIQGIFSDVDFTVLYSWLPSDIGAVITAVIAVFIFLGLIGLIKKMILFFG